MVEVLGDYIYIKEGWNGICLKIMLSELIGILGQGQNGVLQWRQVRLFEKCWIYIYIYTTLLSTTTRKPSFHFWLGSGLILWGSQFSFLALH